LNQRTSFRMSYRPQKFDHSRGRYGLRVNKQSHPHKYFS